MSAWKRRVVVTGVGMITPLGCGASYTWKNLLRGQSGISIIDDKRFDSLDTNIAGQVPFGDGEGDFNPDSIANPKEQKRLEKFILFALGAADEAIKQSGWAPSNSHESERTATIIASGVGGFPATTKAARSYEDGKKPRVSPFLIPSILANLAAGHVAIRHGYKGPIHTPVTACAAGAQSIAEAAKLIRLNEADVVVAGGAEACIDPLSFAGFSAAKALSSRFNAYPEIASRPFDTKRDGFVMGEGAATLILEEREHAISRNANILAELVGYGITSDAYHITSPPENGEGAERAMRLALGDHLPDSVDHIVAHATSTPLGDKSEARAIKQIFGNQGAASPSISAPKASTGHLLGAAGSLAAAISVLSLQNDVVPPIANLEEVDPDSAELGLVSGYPLEKIVNYSLSNGFGFGGINASLLFKK